ncbi:MAG TPA: Holliday junction branch migration protein RuvA [Desulfobacteraceae bacterium]|nr:Holliday junction branch migration protein RuvA [Desulfobacteraceae bacterium]
MIAYLRGQLFAKTTQSVIIETGGIGYEVFVPLSTFYALPENEEDVSLYIYTYVREDALLLFGFHSKLEKTLFLMLTSVSGIGPKLSLNILSGIGPKELLEAIAHGDAIRLQAIPGVGKKTAERIALELKDRATKVLGNEEISPVPVLEEGDRRLTDDALSALLNLGYSPKSAKMAIEKARSVIKEMTLEGLIRESLRVLA